MDPVIIFLSEGERPLCRPGAALHGFLVAEVLEAPAPSGLPAPKELFARVRGQELEPPELAPPPGRGFALSCEACYAGLAPCPAHRLPPEQRA